VPIVRSYEANLHGLVEWLQGVTNRVARWFGRELPSHFFRDRLCIPDPQIAWISWLTGARLVREHDCVYASCSPFSSATVAVWLGRRFGKPVVLDFRDAWLLNPHNALAGLRRRAIVRLERRAFEGATRVIVNTSGAARLYRQTYPEHAAKFVVIPNGYDALTPSPGHGVRAGEFLIVHIGSFYGQRTPDALLEALARIGRRDVVFVHAGAPFASYQRFRERVNIRLLGALPRDEAQQVLQDASLLYLKQGRETGVDQYIAVASKTYEYLATGLPILADCPEGDNAEIVRQYCLAPFVVTTGLVADLERAIREAVDCRLRLPLGLTPDFVTRFDRRSLTAALGDLLDEVVAQGRSV